MAEPLIALKTHVFGSGVLINFHLKIPQIWDLTYYLWKILLKHFLFFSNMRLEVCLEMCLEVCFTSQQFEPVIENQCIFEKKRLVAPIETRRIRWKKRKEMKTRPLYTAASVANVGQGHWWKLDRFLAWFPRFKKNGRRTDGPTDRRTDRPKHRVACSWLKTYDFLPPEWLSSQLVFR